MNIYISIITGKPPLLDLENLGKQDIRNKIKQQSQRLGRFRR